MVTISEFWCGFIMGSVASLLFLLTLGSWYSHKKKS